MNKQELIKRISELPYSEGPIADIVTVNRNWILESIEQLDKPQEVPVPQFVADYIKYAIENDWDFQDLFKRIEDEEDEELLKMKNAYYNKHPQFLCETDNGIFWAAEIDLRKTKFTRKELEEAGFGGVFKKRWRASISL